MSLVTVRSIGRTGNLLFQLAAAIAYAKRHGMRWGVPMNLYENPDFMTWFPHLPRAEYSPGERYEQHDPKDFGYKPIPYFPHGVTLIGYFQSLKWFEDAQNEVKEAFKLPHVPGYEDYVSIHVRRGDYVQNQNSFPPVTAEYIQSAVAMFPGRKLVVISDGIEWCKNEISGSNVEYSEGRNTFEDLSLMASCSDHIIANSTFSWWGAYLGRNPDKVIVSPSHDNYFGPNGPKDTKDYLPGGWHQIKFR